MKLHFLDLPPESGKERVLFFPIPYEGTVSFMPGTRFAPAAILHASVQLEQWDTELEWDPSTFWSFETLPPLRVCTAGPEKMLEQIYCKAKEYIPQGFLFALGGEHSITYPLVRAHRDHYGPLGVVQIDAHSDLRDNYEGSPFSHACVMRRVAELDVPILQLGIRSQSQEEYEFAKAHSHLHIIYAPEAEKLSQKDFRALLSSLPEKIYLTVDVDGLDPSVIPGTGTPEPGGLSWYQTLCLLRTLAEEKEILGVDLVELSPRGESQLSEYTAAKLVYKILGYIGFARKSKL